MGTKLNKEYMEKAMEIITKVQYHLDRIDAGLDRNELEIAQNQISQLYGYLEAGLQGLGEEE